MMKLFKKIFRPVVVLIEIITGMTSLAKRNADIGREESPN